MLQNPSLTLFFSWFLFYPFLLNSSHFFFHFSFPLRIRTYHKIRMICEQLLNNLWFFSSLLRLQVKTPVTLNKVHCFSLSSITVISYLVFSYYPSLLLFSCTYFDVLSLLFLISCFISFYPSDLFSSLPICSSSLSLFFLSPLTFSHSHPFFYPFIFPAFIIVSPLSHSPAFSPSVFLPFANTTFRVCLQHSKLRGTSFMSLFWRGETARAFFVWSREILYGCYVCLHCRAIMQLILDRQRVHVWEQMFAWIRGPVSERSFSWVYAFPAFGISRLWMRKKNIVIQKRSVEKKWEVYRETNILW